VVARGGGQRRIGKTRILRSWCWADQGLAHTLASDNEALNRLALGCLLDPKRRLT